MVVCEDYHLAFFFFMGWCSLKLTNTIVLCPKSSFCLFVYDLKCKYNNIYEIIFASINDNQYFCTKY